MLTAGVACELRKAINAGSKLLFGRGLATPGAFAKSRLPARVMQPSGLRPSPTDAAAEKALGGAHWAPAPHRGRGVWIAESHKRGPRASF